MSSVQYIQPIQSIQPIHLSNLCAETSCKGRQDPDWLKDLSRLHVERQPCLNLFRCHVTVCHLSNLSNLYILSNLSSAAGQSLHRHHPWLKCAALIPTSLVTFNLYDMSSCAVPGPGPVWEICHSSHKQKSLYSYFSSVYSSKANHLRKTNTKTQKVC